MSDGLPGDGVVPAGGASALTVELERKRFQELCDLLPADVNWFDPITPAIMREIVIAIETRKREACAKVCEDSAEILGARDLANVANACADIIRKRSNYAIEGPTDGGTPAGGPSRMESSTS